MNNLFAILTSPGFAREFDKADENVHPDDKPLPTEGGLFDEILTPRDPYGCENPVSQEDSE